jgi:hypothetical protein
MKTKKKSASNDTETEGKKTDLEVIKELLVIHKMGIAQNMHHIQLLLIKTGLEATKPKSCDDDVTKENLQKDALLEKLI